MPIPFRPAIGFAAACVIWLLSAGGAGFVVDAHASAVQQPSTPSSAQPPTPAQPSTSTPSAPSAPAAPATPQGADAPDSPAPPGAPVRDSAKPAAPKTGRSIIRGRVVALDSGTPVRRALVRLMGPEMRMPRAAFTDAQGNYELKGLPAGRYQIGAKKGGFVSVYFGQRRPLEQGRPIELAEGQTLDKVDFHLPRGGVIVGRIVDELGETVTGAGVRALVSRRIGGKRRLVAAGYAQTNDIGQYRLFGLPPGEYYVAAGGVDAALGNEGETDNPSGSGYAATYYPGTPSLGEAHRVAVNIGAEISADLQLTPTRVSKISGTIVGQNGRGAPAAFVSLQPRDPELAESDGGISVASVGAEGAFTISNVAPGAYYLTGTVIEELTFSGKRSSGWTAITVTGQDIEGVRIVATKGATIKGRVKYEGEARPKHPLGYPLMVGCDGTGNDGPSMMTHEPPARVDEHGEFEVTGVYRECLIRAFPTPDDWGIATVTHDADDVTDRPIAIKEAETISDVTITLTNRFARLTGTVTDADNRPAKDYVVIIFPEDAEKLGPRSRYVRTARGDQEGQFKMSGLPPGEYLAAAFDTVEEGAEFDPEFLDRVRPSSVPLRVGDEGNQTIRLKLTTPTP